MMPTLAGVIVGTFAYVTVHDHVTGRSFVREYSRCRVGETRWEFADCYECNEKGDAKL